MKKRVESGSIVFSLLILLITSCSQKSTLSRVPTPLPPTSTVFSSSSASTLKLPLSELTRQAQFILIGKVQDLHSAFNEDRTNIFTDISINPGSWIKGDAGPHPITIRIPGGESEGLREYVTDVPTFSEGEEDVLFLTKNSDNFYDVVGGFQGKFSINNHQVYYDYNEEPISEFINRIQNILNENQP